MNLNYVRRFPASAADEDVVRAIHRQMIAAWNANDVNAFTANFADGVDFVAFEGTHMKGRDEVIRFHRPLFETILKGSRMSGEVKFVRFISSDYAVMHSVVSYALAGQTASPASRDSMQLTVVSCMNDTWRVEALMNARRVTLERQTFLDSFELLPADAQQRVNDLIASLETPRLHENI